MSGGTVLTCGVAASWIEGAARSVSSATVLGVATPANLIDLACSETTSSATVLGVATSCGLGSSNLPREVAGELVEPPHVGDGVDPCARAAVPEA